MASLLLPVLVALATAPDAPAPSRLAVASGLRLREAPRPEAAVVERVAIGTVLPCLEQSAPVQVDGSSGPFCRTQLPDGRKGWFYLPLTAPLEPDADAQLERLIHAKAKELEDSGEERRSDLYDLHRLVLRRIAEAKDAPARMRMRLAELELLRAHPDAFHADPRVYQDEAQGPRLRRQALWALVDEAKGTPTAETAAWVAVQHGHDFECESNAPCIVSWARLIECEYLSRFPEGPHAREALTRLREMAVWVADEGAAETPPEELVPPLLDAQRCVASAKGPGAAETREAFEKALAAARSSKVKSTP